MCRRLIGFSLEFLRDGLTQYHLGGAPKKEGEVGEKIPTGVFQQKEYAWLSGLLCSRAEALNRPMEMGVLVQSCGERLSGHADFLAAGKALLAASPAQVSWIASSVLLY